MSMFRTALAVAVGLFIGASAAIAAPITPLDSGNWYQVARAARDGGVFDGNGDLKPTYSYGTFTSALQLDDFARPFDVWDGMKILFVTGNREVWAVTGYDVLRNLIDAKAGAFGTNFVWEQTSIGANIAANVLSRSGPSEDPWISLAGGHFAAINNAQILWGENNYVGSTHAFLSNQNDGVNVYVSVQPPAAVPLPASLPLLAAGLLGAGLLGRRRSRAAMSAQGS